jgi:hypothetical protein
MTIFSFREIGVFGNKKGESKQRGGYGLRYRQLITRVYVGPGIQ